jgi:hypothetical protein
MKPIALTLLLVLAPLCARADVVLHGFTFPDTVHVEETELQLNGSGLLRYFFFKVYVSALYLGEGVKPEQVFDDVPKRLEIGYLRSFSKAMIVDAGNDALAENVPAGTLARIQPQVDAINAMYEDVKAGDVYALTYIPGLGTELALNGVRKGVVPGAEFGAQYFKIWLGASDAVQDLKAALLRSR